MSLVLSESDKANLKAWIRSSLASSTNSLAAGVQGQTLIYRDAEKSLVIKVPHGRGLLRWFRVRMLQHEYAAYKKLGRLSMVPQCYGLLDNQYLVLQYINGAPIRQSRPVDTENYFQKMFQAINQIHAAGIAHMDLKKKDNLLVINGNTPCIIDFGAAVIYKPGFHPFNHWRYNLAVRFDFNAWIKHKYHDRIEEISKQDQLYYKKTLAEISARIIKRFYKFKILPLLHHITK